MDRCSDRNTQTQEIPDGILVQRSISGDHQAFEDLVKRYHPVLENCIARWCLDASLIPDLVQAVLLQLYLSLPLLHINRSLKAWLAHVAHNCCVNEYRRTRPFLFSQLASLFGQEDLDLLATLPDPDPSPEERVEQQEWQKQILQAIRALPVKQQRVVWLRYTDQLSFTDIGRQLHIPAATARTTFARAKPTLRRLLTEEASSTNT